MPIQITNSLTKKKEELIPQDGKTINIYSCGVTVYDVCHIGHARSLYVFDVIKRYLKYHGFDVRFVRNITDVDDKIINRAKELGKDAKTVADENIDLYYRDLKNFGIEKADVEPRATENIKDMVGFIKNLIERDIAYAVEGDVYYSVRAFKEYGKLSGQSIDKMMDSVRIEEDLRKKDPLDFALWKSSADDEPGWDSPWGRGRPGWHIECSCMSMKHLHCETLDIHAGGRDLIFPHHENEIAQSEGLTGKPFARYWIHHGLLTINSQKMAKSLGNFITVDDAINKYGVDELKLFFLSSHYASPIDFSEEKMTEMRKQKAQFSEFFDKVTSWQLYNGDKPNAAKDKDLKKIEETREKFIKAMDDDFNTPQAMATLFEFIDFGSQLIGSDKYEAARKVYETIEDIFVVFGLNVKSPVKVSDEVRKLVRDRQNARRDKDFKKADEIRDQIRDHFQLCAVDTQGGVAFYEDIQ